VLGVALLGLGAAWKALRPSDAAARAARSAGSEGSSNTTAAAVSSAIGGDPAVAGTPTTSASTDKPLTTNEAAQAVMVTVELDFGGSVPRIREALKEIERRYQPDDGQGRTFAILDAYGEGTSDGKLHLSMHVSMEKPGLAELRFRRTGEVLWKSRILPNAKASLTKNLKVYMEDFEGRSALLDGSKEILSVLDVPLSDLATGQPLGGQTVRDRWPDGQVCEFTFVYSTCGCPVKAKVRRQGGGTVRATELPVMFPDDPAAMAVINQLMGWPTTE
jgi:hypothetical protein